MPYFIRQVAPTGALMLLSHVGVSTARRTALSAAGQPVPPAVMVQAMVDTGASCTCVDPSILDQLGLKPTGSVPLLTPSTGATPVMADQYDIGLAIVARTLTDALVRDPVPVVASELLSSQGFHVLLGRDILSTCVLVYHGYEGSFTFAY